MPRVAAVVIGLSLLPALTATAHAQQQMKLGEVLLLDVVDTPTDSAVGQGAHLFEADRGARKGQRVLASTSGANGSPRMPDPQRRLEYHLLSPDNVGVLPAVDVLGIHYVKVREDRRAAFERFIAEKVHPAVGNLRPDLRILYYKAARVSDSGNYIALFALTRSSRDKYWPKGADSDELRAAFSPAVRELTKELSTYLVEGSYAADPKLAAAVFESREWTDFVLVSRAAGKDGRR